MTALSTVIASAVVCAVGMSALGRYLQYESTHDIPNPAWGVFSKSYTYTPATATSLNPILLKTRPDLMVLRFIQDYAQYAGTYPCAPDLATYSEEFDPILALPVHTCSVKRPMADVTVNHVYVGILGPDTGSIGAIVRFTVAYADGEHWTSQEELDANQYQRYWLGYIELTCWDSPGITELYGYLVPLSQAPSGMEYVVRTPTSVQYLCKS